MHLPAVALEHAHLVVDAPALVEREIGVLRTLDVDVGMERFDCRQRGRLLDDRDVVDDLERRDLARALIFGERHRALLGDVRVAGQGHDQQVAHLARLLEMREVAEVHEVERPVAVDDPPIAEALAYLREVADGDNLVALSRAIGCANHAGCPSPDSSNPGRLAQAIIPSRLAPSAKTFTRKRDVVTRYRRSP